MKQQEILERLTARFGGDVIRSITFLDQVTALAPAEKIVEICEFLKTDPELNFDMLTFVGGVDRMPAVPRFEVVYQLYSVKQKHRFRVKAPLEDPSEGLPCIDTVTGVWTTANWHERETSEMYGITFLNHPDPRKLLLPEEWSVCPLRKDFPVEGTDETPDLPHNPRAPGDIRMPEPALDGYRSEIMEINLGPHHPSTHGVFRAMVELDGEVVVSVIPHLGYLHRGYEKLCENKRYHQVIPLTERCDYMGASVNSLLYCMTVEKMLGVEAPPRAQVIRVVMAELSRIFSHLFWLGTHGHDVGAMTPLFYMLREREEIMDLFELTAGGRLMPTYMRIGGVAKDLADHFVERLKAFTDHFDYRVDEYETLLTKNPIYIDRTKGVGYLSPDDAVAYGITGPMIRAAGIPLDIRKTQPYCGYEEYDFNIPTNSGSDVYARYLVRVAEMRESNAILKQAVDKLNKEAAEGPVKAKAPGKIFPAKEDIYNAKMEALIHHFMLVIEGEKVPEGEYYQCIESPRGELGCYLVGDGSGKPARLKWRAPAFVNLQSLAKMTVGSYFADLIAILSSVDIVLAEVDR